MRHIVRILVADNDVDLFQVVDQQIDRNGLSDAVDITYIDTCDGALELVEARHFDLAFIDLRLDVDDHVADGLEVIREIGETLPACIRVLTTSYADEDYEKILPIVGTPGARGVHLLNKNDETVDRFASMIRSFFGRRIEAKWSLQGLEPLLKQLETKRDRIVDLRAPMEVSAEVEALLFQLFDESAGMATLGDSVEISLSDLEPGLSASVTQRATPRFGLDAGESAIVGNRCVVKIGPLASVRDEALRYNAIVKLGFASEFRVEMLSWCEGNTLAAICYSFAGGNTSDAIKSFDQLMLDGEFQRAKAVIEQLFSKDQRRWYLIEGKAVVARDYYGRVFQTVFGDQVEHVHDFLETAPECKLVKDTVQFENFTFPVISKRHLGRGFLGQESPTCVVHGDLHGGNILCAGVDKVSLIDFATAGFGPIFADGAALSATLRLRPLKDLSGSEHFISAGRAYGSENALYRSDTHPMKLERLRLEPWFSLSETLHDKMFECFTHLVPLDLERELARTALLYAISIFNLQIWNRVQKMRIIAWMSALLRTLELA